METSRAQLLSVGNRRWSSRCRIFESMAGDGKYDSARACFPKLEQPGDGSRAGRFDEYSFALREPALRGKNVLVANDANLAVALLQSEFALCQLAGLPMRIAVATVWGDSTIRL